MDFSFVQKIFQDFDVSPKCPSFWNIVVIWVEMSQSSQKPVRMLVLFPGSMNDSMKWSQRWPQSTSIMHQWGDRAGITHSRQEGFCGATSVKLQKTSKNRMVKWINSGLFIGKTWYKLPRISIRNDWSLKFILQSLNYFRPADWSTRCSKFSEDDDDDNNGAVHMLMHRISPVEGKEYSCLMHRTWSRETILPFPKFLGELLQSRSQRCSCQGW